MLQKGFAFVQFDQEQVATNAIDNENGLMLKNKNIVVRCAAMKPQKGNPNKNNQNNNVNQQHSRMGRSRSPVSGNENRGGPRNQKNANPRNSNSSFFGNNINQQNNSFNSPGMPSLMNVDTSNVNANVDGGYGNYNDCEIIVVSRALT